MTHSTEDTRIEVELDRRISRGEVRQGAIRTGAVEIEWTAVQIRVRSTDEAWLEIGDGDVPTMQLSRSAMGRRGWLGRLLKRTETAWLYAELRLATDDRIQLSARLAAPELVADLPVLQPQGAVVSARALLDLLTVARLLGARMAVWSRAAAEAEGSPRVLLPARHEPFVEVAAYFNPVDAHVARLALEGSGIEVRVQDEHTVSIDPLSSVALGGVKIRVPQSRAPEAARILRDGVAAVEAEQERP